MKKIVKFYLPEGSLNDATSYYVDIIKRALDALAFNVKVISDIGDVKNGDVLFTIEAFPLVKCKLKHPNIKVFNWFQGAFPEEVLMVRKSRIYKFLFDCIEFAALKLSSYNFMVSDAMLKHYEKKYRLKLRDSTLIIPCYNKPLDCQSFFYPEKYTVPTFVYAGSISEWQCIDETLKLFKLIEDTIPQSKLVLLTKEVEGAEELIKNNLIKNYEVKYVPLPKLQLELTKYKYGFLIRKKNVVNEVATPTKMNSYLSAGIIPIYTDAVEDFKKIELGEYALKLLSSDNIYDWSTQIIRLEKQLSVHPALYLQQLKKVFKDYYNDEKYIKSIVTSDEFRRKIS